MTTGPRGGDIRKIVNAVEQLRGPLPQRVIDKVAQWSDPVYKLSRKAGRAERAARIWLAIAFVLAVIGIASILAPGGDLALGIGTGTVAVLATASAVSSRTKAKHIRGEVARLQERRGALPPNTPLPARGSQAREPMQQLAELESTLAELLDQLSGPHAAVPAESVAQARATGAEASGALRSVAAKLQALERAVGHASAADRDDLSAGVDSLRAQLDDGLDGYRGLIAAAGRVVAASSSSGGQDKASLANATDHLAGLAAALRELFPDAPRP